MKYEVVRINSVDWLFIIPETPLSQESVEGFYQAFKDAGLRNVVILNDA